MGWLATTVQRSSIRHRRQPRREHDAARRAPARWAATSTLSRDGGFLVSAASGSVTTLIEKKMLLKEFLGVLT